MRLATNAPAFCCSVSTVSAARLDRLKFQVLGVFGQLLLSGISIEHRRDSLHGFVPSPSPQPSPAFAGEAAGEEHVRLSGLQDVVRPSASLQGAELVGLERVEHAQHLLRVAGRR